MDSKSLVAAWDGYFAEVMKAGGGPLPPRFPNPQGAFSRLLSDWYGAYSGHGSKAPLPAFIPEPYLGDMLAPRIRMVLLNLNPGRPLDNGEQVFSRSSAFGSRIAADGYRRWAAPNPYLATSLAMGSRFWQRRLRFASSLLGTKVAPSELLAMELWPWHSVKWGGFDARAAAGPVRECVIEPLLDLARSHPDLVIVAERKEHTNVLTHLGCGTLPGYGPMRLPSGIRDLSVYRLSDSVRVMVVVSRNMAGLPSAHGTDGGRDLAAMRSVL